MRDPLRASRGTKVLFLLMVVALSSPRHGRVLAAEERVRWTASRFAGTPDPPLPYVVEPAFPKLQFDRPLLLEAMPGSRRLFVGEVSGKILTFNETGADQADLAIDLARARPGLSAVYGLTFHPRFEENRYVFVCYVMQNDTPDGTRLSRFTVSRTDPPVIAPESETLILTWPSGGHNGGCLAFGPDKMLYVSTGDAGPASPPDPIRTGQDISDLLSSILRIDVDHSDAGRAYRVPADNPFVKTPGARPEVWAFGLRNPWRMSFNRATGDLWVGDVGWELWELIYRVERGGNYGWSVREGRQPVHVDSKRGPTPIVPPVVDHPHSEAASITGGYVYRGGRLKDLVGTYVYGDYQSGKVWGLRYEAGKVTRQSELADTGLRIVSFGEGHDGELYLIEYERSNQIYRLAPNPVPRNDNKFPRRLSETGLFASVAEHTAAPGVVPYAINAEAWMDGASAERLLAIPGAGRIEIGAEDRWRLPEGTVLAKTVSLDLDAGEPRSRRRLETQVLHLEAGSWRPYSYVWNDEQTDATLAGASGASRTFTVRDQQAPGGKRETVYRFAARSECVLCHNPWVEARTTVFGRQSASPLAFEASQLDRDGAGSHRGENQLVWLERLAYFTGSAPARRPPRLVNPYDAAADLDARARSYLQVNCAHCHQFNAGGSATIALPAALPLDQTKTVDVPPIQGAFGIDGARIIAPGDPSRSVLFFRVAKTGAGRMPRVGSRQVDERGLRLLADWIARLPRARGDEAGDGDVAALKSLESAHAAGRTAALRTLMGSTRGALAVIQRAVQGKLPAPVLQEAVTIARDHRSSEVRDLFERFLPDAERVKRLGDTIDPEDLLALPGDVGRGREWFFSESATSCKSCHRAEGRGTELGPDLSTVGSKYSRRDLLRQILEPSREVDPKFATRAIATRDGQVHVGVLASRSDREVVLRDAQNKTERIATDVIEQETLQPVSLMPEGLLRDLTAQQAADLLEYLASLKER